MSRSNPTPSAPVHKYMTWAGGSGELQWYDKEAQKRVKVPLPFRFLYLDQLVTITGFSDSDKSGIWSNEVRSIKDQLVVKTSSGTIATGSYESLKDHLKAQGGKYACSVYIAYQEASGEDAEWVIGNIKFSGAGLGAWFDFRKRHNLEEGAIRITGSATDKKGATTFHIPVIQAAEATSTEDDLAKELDTQVQQYLKTYLAQRKEAEVVTEEDITEDLDVDKPIDLSEIPF